MKHFLGLQLYLQHRPASLPASAWWQIQDIMDIFAWSLFRQSLLFSRLFTATLNILCMPSGSSRLYWESFHRLQSFHEVSCAGLLHQAFYHPLCRRSRCLCLLGNTFIIEKGT
jgi:hypothetical protein